MSTSFKIVSADQAAHDVQSWKKEGQKIVFTNGCFDILHLGHIDYLEKSRSQGDRLVVGLNTDSSIKRIKGENRPINDEIVRARLLAALAFVDRVVLFGEDTPRELIQKLSPNILIKGNDYNVSNIVGADFVIANGGEVKTIKLVEGYSTTSIIDKIKNS